MNEVQHHASVNVQAAQGRVKVAADELAKARSTLRDAEKTLAVAIRRDPASWYATPGVKREETGICETG